jgi:flap endonuclease-1
MGIKGLSKFIKIFAPNAIEEIGIDSLKNMTIGFDTSILIYQFVIAVRGHGKDLTNNAGEITSHVHGTIMKLMSFLKKQINPIFVIDGKPPDIKLNTLKERGKIRQMANDELTTNTELDEEQKNKLFKQSVVITHEQMNECVQILKKFGMPTIQAKQEADAQCAYLSKIKLVDAIASEDMDLLTFGTEVLLRDISKEKIVKYTLSKILAELKISYLQFIDLCILLGCDYCPTIDGVGPKIAFQLIKTYGSIDNIINNIPYMKKKITVTDIFKERYIVAREYFLQPPIYTQNEFPEIRWNSPNYEEIKQLLVTKYSYDIKSVDRLLFKQLKGGHLKNIADKNVMQVFVDRTFTKWIPDESISQTIADDSDSDDFIDSDEKSVDAAVALFGNKG